jgi:hypothetical protein
VLLRGLQVDAVVPYYIMVLGSFGHLMVAIIYTVLPVFPLIIMVYLLIVLTYVP